MLFMVIEHFKNQDVEAVRKRFREKGRMLPENVAYRASWIESNGARCFQIMEAPDAAALRVWSERWEDLVDFEVVPVVTSEEFWSRVAR
jgi:Protein of unknown function (DUF3303)